MFCRAGSPASAGLPAAGRQRFRREILRTSRPTILVTVEAVSNGLRTSKQFRFPPKPSARVVLMAIDRHQGTT
jgi:hypothetical protein